MRCLDHVRSCCNVVCENCNREHCGNWLSARRWCDDHCGSWFQPCSLRAMVLRKMRLALDELGHETFSISSGWILGAKTQRAHRRNKKKKRPNMIDQKPCPNKSQGILRFAHLLRRDLFAPVIHVVGWCRGDTSWSARTLTRYNVTRLTCQNYAMVRPLSRFGRILAWHWTVAIALGLQKVVSDTGPMGPTT